MDVGELGEDKFISDAAIYFFNLAYKIINDKRKAVVEQGLTELDKGICGKRSHFRVNKEHLNLYEEFC
jgi:hypothetical protein